MKKARVGNVCHMVSGSRFFYAKVRMRVPDCFAAEYIDKNKVKIR